MESFNKNMKCIRNMLSDKIIEKYIINNTEIIKQDEYMKNLYLKMLCTVVQYQNEPSDAQTIFLKRIIKGVHEEATEEYMRKALEISQTDIEEFLSAMSQNRIKYYVALEAIILISLGNSQKAGYEYLAEIIELMNINKDDLAYISLVAKSVLQQESSFFDDAKEMINDRVRDLNFTPYIKNYYAGAIIDSPTEKYYFALDKKDSKNIQYNDNYHEKKVTFENLEIEFNNDWKFYACQEVIFRNCNLTGKDSNSIYLSAVETVTFENCNVRGFQHRVAHLSGVKNIYIIQNEFTECGTEDDRYESARGGVFYCRDSEVNNIVIKENKVLHCYIKENLNSYHANGIFINFDDKTVSSMTVENNEFAGCKFIGVFSSSNSFLLSNSRTRQAMISNFRTDHLIESNNRLRGEVTKLFYA